MTKFIMMFVFWLCLLLSIAPESALADEMTLQDMQKFLGNYKVNCQNMVLVKAEGENDFISKLELLSFDQETCEKVLKLTDIDTVLEPIYKLVLAEGDNDHQYDFWALNRILIKYRSNGAVKAVHRNAEQMAKACSNAALGYGKDQTRICYFGGPTDESDPLFKALFKAMLENSLPDNSTLCSEHPLTPETARSKPFKDMLVGAVGAVAWNAIRLRLEADGFLCGQDECTRNVMGIILPGKKMIEQMRDQGGNQSPNGGKMVLYPRQMRIYLGEWKTIGPRGCIRDLNQNESGECRPKLEAASGVCLAKEDFHVWFRVVQLLNEIEQ
jgi:hypothetical protein